MMGETKKSSSWMAKGALYSITLLNTYIYTCLSVIVMQFLGFPYQPFSDVDLLINGLYIAAPVFLPIAYLLSRLKIEKMQQRSSARAMFRFYVFVIPALAVYCFLFMYININFAPGGERLCSGEVIDKSRVKVQSGISYRFQILCEEALDQSFLVERRVPKDTWQDTYKGDLRPLTYIKGRLGVDLIVKRN